ncbi:HesA/MoeB/ThiF family protein [Bradyrhizobium sp. USDA 223]|uniref:HesA/MoeB/ThiF family protein n=1 Tax=Bradyrhizobium sp. USDA 223 TaxID=3156306 RepID=UPI003834EAA3
MIRVTFTILEEQRALLQRSIFRDESEYAALLLCGRSRSHDPWTGGEEERIVAREIIEVPESAFIERSPVGFTWLTAPFYQALKRAEPQNFAVAVIHSHPAGYLRFSSADDLAEKETFEIAFNRLESDRPHLSLIMTADGRLAGRAYGPNLKPRPLDMIRVLGSRWRFTYPEVNTETARPAFDRQVRAFGQQSTLDLSRLRIGVVGCGGTGSAVAALLARIGVRHLALFDTDFIDETNLNRLHYSTRTDANLRRLKVDVLGEAIAGIGLPISVARIPHHVEDIEARDALKSCDVVFGCTDDHLGRNVLNRLAHFYFIPIIDLGLLIDPRSDGGYDAFDGRVTVVQPGSPCQVCRGLIKSDIMLHEGLRRKDPAVYEQRRRAGYVADAADPSPVVVTFTTEVATMAVNELFQRLNVFRGDNGAASERVRRFDEVKEPDLLPSGKSRPGCKLCNRRRYDGRGDMDPFLDTTS